MRPYLTALTALLGAMLLYHGLVLRGLIPGQAAPMAPAAAELLIAAAAAMGLAGVTLRAHSGLAAVEMALAGVVVLAIAGPDHRYLLAYGAVALALAMFAAVDAARPPSPRHRQQQNLSVSRHTPPPGDIVTPAEVDPAPHPVQTEQPRHDPVAAQRVLRHVADTRGRRRAARQAWRSWRADPAPRQEEPPTADAPTAAPDASVAADPCATDELSESSAEGR